MRRRDLTALFLAGAAAPAPSAQTVHPDAGVPRDASEAEVRAAVNPLRPEFAVGDIRRYGADIDAHDNSGAINAALLVSAQAGPPAFIPGGSWTITQPLRALQNCSMYGVGAASIIAAQACDGLVFGSSGNYAITGLSRFFRDFQLVGSDPLESMHRGLVVDFSSRSTQRVNGVAFENIHVANFGTGAHLRGLWFSNFVGCHFYNCYRGIFFIGENCVNSIVNCTLNRANIRGSGGAWGISFQSIDGESTQSTRIISGQVYFYDVLINVLLAFELQIEHCDLSAAQAVGVQIYGTIGGCWLRDCWVETANSGPTIGVRVMNIQPTSFTAVHLVGNHINCDNPARGSQGICVGNANAGIIINENAILGFDRAITLGASRHLICKFNRLNCVTAAYGPSSHAVFLDSLAVDNEIGPNEVIPGKTQAAIMQAGDPRIRVSDSNAFPIGTAVEFDGDAHGFFRAVTYFVLTSASNAITVGATPAGNAIPAGGDGPLGVFPAPQPLTFSAGTPRGLSFHGRGAFSTSLTGFAETVPVIVDWSANGGLVALTARGAASLTGTSNSTEMRALGVPAFLRPVVPQAIFAGVVDSGAWSAGLARITPAGVLEFFATPGFAGFTPAGIKGVALHTLIYPYG